MSIIPTTILACTRVQLGGILSVGKYKLAPIKDPNADNLPTTVCQNRKISIYIILMNGQDPKKLDHYLSVVKKEETKRLDMKTRGFC